MGYGVHSVFSKTLAGGASQTTLPFNVERAYDHMYLQVATMASVANISLDVSADGGETYYQLRHTPPFATATVTVPTFIVAATAAANGAMVPIPTGFRHFRVVVDSAPTAAVGFKVICGA